MRVAIITARGGSKRIPRKNIREFCGKPIIAYSIETALESGCFDEVMVSTDDDEIAGVARGYGAAVPFKRSAATATDQATTAEVLLEVLEKYREAKRDIGEACCIYPTAPFITPESLRAGRDLLLRDRDTPCVIPVVRFSYPIQRALRVRDGTISLFQPEHLNTRSQDLEPGYHDAGQFYWFRADAFERTRSLMAPGTAAVILPEWQVQDIDNEDDWIVAEMKYRMIRQHAAAAPAG
jgi:pseudaminic acid cytidylyltransferase